MRTLTLFLLLTCVARAEERHAKNVILFLGDAGGIPTLNAASIYGYGAPLKLFLQHMPNIGLSDTSPSDVWVTDSAAGMTAIVTGQKTKNGVISESSDTIRGVKDRAPLKTILEYAEEHGLSTGVISNMPMADATPAACYAHANDRAKFGEIFAQVLDTRFGDGVDLVLGGGRKAIFMAMESKGVHLPEALTAKGIQWYDDPAKVPVAKGRAVALSDEVYDPLPVV